MVFVNFDHIVGCFPLSVKSLKIPFHAALRRSSRAADAYELPAPQSSEALHLFYLQSPQALDRLPCFPLLLLIFAVVVIEINISTSEVSS